MAFADATPALNGLCWKIIAENLIETPPQNPLIEWKVSNDRQLGSATTANAVQFAFSINYMRNIHWQKEKGVCWLYIHDWPVPAISATRLDHFVQTNARVQASGPNERLTNRKGVAFSGAMRWWRGGMGGKTSRDSGSRRKTEIRKNRGRCPHICWQRDLPWAWFLHPFYTGYLLHGN